MERRTVSKRLRLCFRPSIRREEEVSEDMPPITGLFLLLAELRNAELCVVGCKFVVRQSHVCAYPKHLAGFLVVILYSSITNSSHCCYHRKDPLIQSP